MIGADDAKFQITTEGVLTFIAAPNFEANGSAATNNTYVVNVRATDAVMGGTTDQLITVTVSNVDEAPAITSNGGGATTGINVAENATTAVTTVTATDGDAGATQAYSLNGGADAARFAINGTTGVLTFLVAPNFEAPTDADTNNTYVVVVRVSDGVNTDDQTITVTITDVNEAPVFFFSSGPAPMVAQTALVVVPAATTVQLTKTTTLSTTGGSGTGAVTYATSTPTICSVTTAGVVFAVAVGTCSVTATKASDGSSYLAATSAPVTITMSNSDALAAAAALQAAADKVIADKAAADKVIADKAAADKVIADKAAADKVIADKAAADKAAADKAAADKAAADKVIADKAATDKAAADAAASEGGGGTAIDNSLINSIKYSTNKSKITTIKIDLADEYGDLLVDVSVKTTVLVKGKKVTKYVTIGEVTLNEIGQGSIKTNKAKIIIKAGDVIRVSFGGITIKTITVKAAADTVIADKAAADKVIADKAAADAAASEGGGGTAIDNSLINSIKYSTNKSKITTIKIDLADEYGDLLVDVSVKTTVLVKGKKVTKYVTIGEVTLNEIGQGSIKTNKAKIIIKAGDVIRVSFGGITIKTITVK